MVRNACFSSRKGSTVQFPVPVFGSSQQPIIPAPGNLVPLSGLHEDRNRCVARACTHTHTHKIQFKDLRTKPIMILANCDSHVWMALLSMVLNRAYSSRLKPTSLIMFLHKSFSCADRQSKHKNVNKRKMEKTEEGR